MCGRQLSTCNTHCLMECIHLVCYPEVKEQSMLCSVTKNSKVCLKWHHCGKPLQRHDNIVCVENTAIGPLPILLMLHGPLPIFINATWSPSHFY